MTREKQIRKYAEEKCMRYDDIGFDDEAYTLIIETLEWADENPKEGLVSIDTVCNYLKHNLSKFGSEQDKTWNENIEIFVNKFKSAMEE